LGIERVIVPPHAGVLSAMGLAMTPERRETMGSVLRRLDEWSDDDRLALLSDLAARLPEDLKKRKWLARMRYVGQGHELDVPMTPKQSRTALEKAFQALHEQRYGFTLPQAVEVVSARHVAEGSGRRIKLRREDRPALRRADGPASVALADATLFVARGWRARLLESGAWQMERR
jgi:N-methylhydantoinase A